MCGLTAPGTTRIDYVCPHNPNNPRHAARTATTSVPPLREHVIYAAADQIITGLLGGDHIPATQAAAADTRATHQADQLHRRITPTDTAISGLMT